MTHDLKRINFSVNKFDVDLNAGVLSNLALITADREARGHGIYIDLDTLQGGLESVNARGGQLKGVICHETFDQSWNDEDRLLEVPGYFDNIAIRANTLVAGKFEFYESFRIDQPAAYRRLMEMAQKTPNLFGLSIEATGYAVYLDTEGNEYSQRPEDVDLANDGLPVFRITELDAAAFVSEPAANDGLFAAAMSVLKRGKKLSDSDAAQIGQAFAEWSKNRTEESHQSKPALDGQSPTTKPNQMKKLLDEIKKKFGKDEARMNKALLFAVNATDAENLTLEAVEAALNKSELEELKAANATLKEKLQSNGADNEAVEKLKKEKADLEARFEKLKESGQEKELGIGAPAIVGSGVKFTGKTKALMDEGIIESEKIDIVNKKSAENRLSVHDFLDAEIIAIGLGNHYKSAAQISEKLAAGTTSVSDLWVHENQLQGADEFLVQEPTLINSGAISTNPSLQQAAAVGGNQVKIESFIETYFDSLLQVESTAPTVQKITSGQQLASVLRRVSPVAISAFSKAVSASDPFGFIINRISNLRNLQDQKTLIDEP